MPYITRIHPQCASLRLGVNESDIFSKACGHANITVSGSLTAMCVAAWAVFCAHYKWNARNSAVYLVLCHSPEYVYC